MFNNTVIQQLRQPLEKSRVKHRAAGGGQVSYISGEDAIDTANLIFGYGGWQYETLEVRPIEEKGIIKGYMAHVRLTVGTSARGGNVVISEVGFNPLQIKSGADNATPDAHDLALKGAVTDAMKRCLRVFGDQFGNSLYDKDLVDGQPKRGQAQPAPIPRIQVPVVIAEIRENYREMFESAVSQETISELYNQAIEECLAIGLEERDADEHIKPYAIKRYYELVGQPAQIEEPVPA